MIGRRKPYPDWIDRVIVLSILIIVLTGAGAVVAMLAAVPRMRGGC